MAKFTVYVAGLLQWGQSPAQGHYFSTVKATNIRMPHKRSMTNQIFPTFAHHKPGIMRYLILLVITIQSFFLQGQSAVCTSSCTAGLGENIFPNGDFGSGTSSLLATDPGLAPGYKFAGLVAPPNDGFYVITSNTTNWGDFATTRWINIKDNSKDPNGYMMVVNAAQAPGIFYQNKVSVCPNTLYEMSVDVISLVEPIYGPQSIASNVAFAIDGQKVCATGDIPHDAKWRTFRFSFTTLPSANTVELSFFNNAPGGSGNDLAIDNISFRACGPVLSLPDTTAFCLDRSVTLSVDPKNSPYNTPNYLWQYRDNSNAPWINLSASNQKNWTITKPQNGQQYRVIMANSLQNLDLTYCRVVSPPSSFWLDDLSRLAIGGPDTIVCNGAPAVLEAGPFRTYQWSNGSTAPSINAPAPGWYAVTVSTDNNCFGSDSIYVYEVLLSASANASDPICFGDSTGIITISNRMGGTGALRYAPDADWPWQSNPVLQGIPAGNYLVKVIDSLGCLYEIPLKLSDPPELKVDLGPDRSLLACDPITLTASVNQANLRYLWHPADSLSCANCASTVAMPNISQTYKVTIVNPANCIAVDSIYLTALPRIEVYAPNVFMVNGPPEQAYFTLYPSKSVRIIRQFQVFDRWGNLQFSRSNALPGSNELLWDGYSYQGDLLPEAVYVWQALIEFTDGGIRDFSGNVLLLNGR